MNKTHLLAVAGLVAPASAQDEGSLLERAVPVPAWESATRSLADLGLELDLFYTVDLMSNVSGGVERRTDWIGNLDLLAVADMERLAGWEGGRLSLYLLGNHGGISDAVGDVQGVSNIEGPPTFKVFEAWVEQALFDDAASILAGLYDVNSEFDVIPGAALFLNGSQGMGGELGNSGRNGPSTFPVTSVAARVDVRPRDAFYARFVVADGVPGSLEDDKRTQVRFEDGDGALMIAEAGVLNLPEDRPYGRTRRYGDALPLEERRYGFFGKFALGLWHYTGTFDDFGAVDASGAPVSISADPGLYVLAEQRVFYEPRDPFQGLLLFARAGVADPRTNVFDGYLGGGLVYRGLLPGRDDDQCGVAVAAARFGDDYRASVSTDAAWREWEVAVELTYRFKIAQWLSLQPNLQRVFHPGGDPALEDATVVGIRALIRF